jgi:chromate transporter
MMDTRVGNRTKEVEVTAPAGANLHDAFWVWLRVSVAGIGGAALQIATMHRLLVEEKRWISEERFFHGLSYCIALPGPDTQQLAVYIGWLTRRTVGGLIAGSLFVLPGVICMMALSFGYVTGAESEFGQAIFLGVRPAILAVMAQAILRFGRHVLHNRLMVAVAALAFGGAIFKLPFLLIVGAGALFGIYCGLTGWASLARPVRATVDKAGGAGTHSELSDHTRPSLIRFIRSLTFWMMLWLAPMLALSALFGMNSVFTQISFVFGKVAVMAIGGDYAVVAYAAQQVVDTHHWISAREMQEGIAMGEMVPGTIMIVTQFLGFVTAYRDPGLLPPLLAGTLGGLLATWMTLVPCFLFILVIAPFIEGLRHNVFLNSTLSAVTAAAVGMILYLSVWFGIRTLFHQIETVPCYGLSVDVPVFASLDPWALALFILAAIAMFRFKVGTVVTIFGSSAIGVLLFLLGIT